VTLKAESAIQLANSQFFCIMLGDPIEFQVGTSHHSVLALCRAKKVTRDPPGSINRLKVFADCNDLASCAGRRKWKRE
jgi:hypothetical protein